MHWPPQPGPHDGAKLPRRPALRSFCPPCCPPFFCTLSNPPILHSMKRHHFFLLLLYPPHNHFQNVAVFTAQYAGPWGAHDTLDFITSLGPETKPDISMFPDTFFFFMVRIGGLPVVGDTVLPKGVGFFDVLATSGLGRNHNVLQCVPQNET